MSGDGRAGGPDQPVGLVYRDAAVVRPLGALAAEVDAAALGSVTGALGAVLAAATLETALADAADPRAAAAARITDVAARAWAGGGDGARPSARALVAPTADARVAVTVPEGFAYYALWPRAVAAAARVIGARDLVVVGIRTIGTALAAFVAAALSEPGRRIERFTVRPGGHPHDRRLAFAASELGVVRAAAERGAAFLVVDEGPGLSGSSFLAVAEALVAAGVSAGRIDLLGSRTVDPTALIAADAGRRFTRYRFHAVAADFPWLAPGEIDLSAGAWRALAACDVPVWPQGERRKALAHDRTQLRKFAGLGPWGDAVHARAVALADAGLGPRPRAGPDGDGFVAFDFVPGRPLARADLSPALLAHLASTIATRAALFPATPAPGAEDALAGLVATNAALELGAAPAVRPRLERVAIVDGRLAPHEWIAAGAGWLKTDGTDHGDDHFFPGPTDVAWDLAGAIVEWDLDPAAGAALLEHYRALSGDDARARVPAFLVAYAAFQARKSRLAARAGGAEAARWAALHARQRRALRVAVAACGGG